MNEATEMNETVKIRLLFYKIVVDCISDVYGFLKIQYPKQRFGTINYFRRLINEQLEGEYAEKRLEKIDEEELHGRETGRNET